MIIDALTYVRRRDYLGSPCPDCLAHTMKLETPDILICPGCLFECGRWLTKAEMFELLYSNNEEEDLENYE